jgi:ribonuclease HII
VTRLKSYVIGIDEAGRGPLVGDVFAAAVVLDPGKPIIGLADSKKLSSKRREKLREVILRDALAFGVASASVDEIDTLNILQATLLAMRRACSICVEQISMRQPWAQLNALVDGNRDPNLGLPTICVVKGDSLHAEISAASILAKTARDASLIDLHLRYPEYGFDQHKGYGTALHMKQLKTFGAIAEHRRSFAPVRAVNVRTLNSIPLK